MYVTAGPPAVPPRSPLCSRGFSFSASRNCPSPAVVVLWGGGAGRRALNPELAAAPGIGRTAAAVNPHQAPLAPENRREITTEGGLDLARGGRRLRVAVRHLQDAGLRVSLFIDPTQDAVARATELGVPAVELHTGRYAHGWRRGDAALRQLRVAAARAKALGLAVHAGHGLTYENVQPAAAIPAVEELNIGHSIVSNALYWGLEEAGRRIPMLIDGARSSTLVPP